MEEITETRRNTGVIGDDDAHVKLLAVKVLRQCTDNIGKTTGFDKRYAFGRCK
jgi:hypothetical protein